MDRLKIILKKFQRWFDLNLGWFFVNGRKQEWWAQHLKKKYKDQ